jgi:hypothetical protein
VLKGVAELAQVVVRGQHLLGAERAGEGVDRGGEVDVRDARWQRPGRRDIGLAHHPLLSGNLMYTRW